VSELNPSKNQHAWNITRIAEAFRLSRDTVRKRLREAGVQPALIHRNSPLYELADAGPALFTASIAAGGYGGYETPDNMPPKERKDWFDSENSRLKYEKEKRQLVPDDEVAREMSSLIKSVINPIDGMTDTLERKADLTPKQAEIVQREMDAIREQMYIALIEFDDVDEVGE